MRMVMRVMIAAHGRVVSKRAVQQRTHGFVRAARDTAVKADAGLRKRRLRAAANTAADKRIDAVVLGDCNTHSKRSFLCLPFFLNYAGNAAKYGWIPMLTASPL